MPIRIRFASIDTDGYTGRDPHPPATLIGTEGTLLSVDHDPEGDFLVYSALADADDELYQFVEHELDSAWLDEPGNSHWLAGLGHRLLRARLRGPR